MLICEWIRVSHFFRKWCVCVFYFYFYCVYPPPSNVAGFCAGIIDCWLMWSASVGNVSVEGWIDSLMDWQLGFKVSDAHMFCFQPASLPQCTCLYAGYRTFPLPFRCWNVGLWLMNDLLYSELISFLTLINFSLTYRWSITFSWNRGNLEKQPGIAGYLKTWVTSQLWRQGSGSVHV